MHGGERFPSGATVYLRDGKGRHPLVAGFAASADPSVSFDGQRVLFAGKMKVEDPWQIWEIPLAGGEPRRVTSARKIAYVRFICPKTASYMRGKPAAGW